MKKKLKSLLAPYSISLINEADPLVSNLVNSSKFVVPGSLFILKEKEKEKATSYALEAIDRGASALVSSFEIDNLKLPQAIHPHPEELEPSLANSFYDSPSLQLYTAAVTGTNGKTTTASMIRHFLKSSDLPCGQIGTIEHFTGSKTIEAQFSTPDLLSNYQMMHEMVSEGLEACAFEATSHGLHQKRCEGIHFDAAIFTNLSQDHLDYHKTFDAYFDAKAHLFELLEKSEKKEKIAILNWDDPYSKKLEKRFPKLKFFYYGVSSQADLWIEDLINYEDKTQATLRFKNQAYSIKLPLIGTHNLYNMMAALAASMHRGLTLQELIPHISTLPPLSGRMEVILNKNNRAIYVDFSHTPEALIHALQTLRASYPDYELKVLFGCGGNRDQDKRPMMGKAASDFSDFIYITSDNPRNEDPLEICKDISKGVETSSYQIILDRKEAISLAISKLKKKQLLLIAGRGHESHQKVKNELIPFKDADFALESLQLMKEECLK